VFASLSNGIVKLFNDTFPDLKPWQGVDAKTKQDEAAKQAREQESLGHEEHTKDFVVETQSASLTSFSADNPMVTGYTISNNDADELSYDQDLDKVTTENTTHVASNLNSGNDLNINSNLGNNLIVGSNLSANNDININSLNGETVITSAQNDGFQATSTVNQNYNKISVEYNRGRLSLDSESKEIVYKIEI